MSNLSKVCEGFKSALLGQRSRLSSQPGHDAPSSSLGALQPAQDCLPVALQCDCCCRHWL